MTLTNKWIRFCDIQNNQGRGRVYESKPKGVADNSQRDLDYYYHKPESNKMWKSFLILH